MVNDFELDLVFRALADPTRRQILARLAEGDTTVGEIAAPLAISAPAVSKHLRVLEEAGLLSRTKEGRHHHLGLVPEPLQGASDWLERYRRFWQGQLKSLARYLEETDPEKESP